MEIKGSNEGDQWISEVNSVGPGDEPVWVGRVGRLVKDAVTIFNGAIESQVAVPLGPPLGVLLAL